MHTNHKRKILYLGLDPGRYPEPVFHFPILQIIPRAYSIADWETYTHVIFTSRTAVKLFTYSLVGKFVMAIGKATAALLERVDLIAGEETAEGMVTELKALDLAHTRVLLPCSALSRSVIPDYLESRNVAHTVCTLYDTVPKREKSLPSLDAFEEIVFSSPSTISAFVELYGKLPQNKKLTPIGPITRKALEKFLSVSYSPL